MSSNIPYNSDRFKAICSGLDCPRKPTKLLRIKYVKKAGKFCEVCAAHLFELGLVEEELLSEIDSARGL